MGKKNKKKNKTLKGKGRPKKGSRLSINSGRKKKKLQDASKRTLARRAQDLLNDHNYNTTVISLANRHINSKTENHETDSAPKKHTPRSALEFLLTNDYTKSQYLAIMADTKRLGYNIYPSYERILEEKKKCHPRKFKIINDIEVCVTLQELLNITGERLCEAIVLDWPDETYRNLIMRVSIGFDSSSGHKNPQQKFESEEYENKNAQMSLFVTCIGVIQLFDSRNSEYSWLNPTPMSVRFFRPARICYEKETPENTIREYQRLLKEIKFLTLHNFTLPNKKSVRLKYEVFQTLFDGKCLNTITGNPSSSRCPCCNLTTSEFGKFKNTFTPKEDLLKFGLGLLHCEIKAFEHLMNISYRKPFQHWERTDKNKDKYKDRENFVKEKLYEKFTIRADQLLQGTGTTNTGNLARICFRDPPAFAEALELDQQLVKNISIVLAAFKCKNPLNLEKMEAFCWDTYKLYYKIYPWAKMNPTTHKLLIQGCQIAKHFPLPMAYFAEDGLESWHKYYRSNTKKHCRQSSRKNRILDLYNSAIYMSDPALSVIGIEKRTAIVRKHQISVEVEEYIQKNLLQTISDSLELEDWSDDEDEEDEIDIITEDEC